MDQPLVADRAMLVTQLDWTTGGAPFVLEHPVWIAPGERYWLSEDRQSLVVAREDGLERTYPCGYASGPDAVR